MYLRRKNEHVKVYLSDDEVAALEGRKIDNEKTVAESTKISCSPLVKRRLGN